MVCKFHQEKRQKPIKMPQFPKKWRLSKAEIDVSLNTEFDKKFDKKAKRVQIYTKSRQGLSFPICTLAGTVGADDAPRVEGAR